MAKIHYQRINTPVGVAVYPHLTEADVKYNADGEYHSKLKFARADVEELIEKLEGIRDEYESTLDAKTRKTHNTVDVFEEELDDEGEETGNVLFKVKLKAHVKTKAGKEWDQEPAIFDSTNTKVEDISQLKIWGGSELRVNCEAVPYAMAAYKTIGVSLRLRAVQIVSLAATGGASPFDEFEGGEAIEPTGAPVIEDTPFSEDADDDDF